MTGKREYHLNIMICSKKYTKSKNNYLILNKDV